MSYRYDVTSAHKAGRLMPQTAPVVCTVQKEVRATLLVHQDLSTTVLLVGLLALAASSVGFKHLKLVRVGCATLDFILCIVEKSCQQNLPRTKLATRTTLYVTCVQQELNVLVVTE